MSYERIPLELRLLNQWCVWSYIFIEGQEKPTKIPYNPITGRKVNVTDPATWCNFDNCIDSINSYDGIGFIFSINDDYCGIDLDAGGNLEHHLAIFNKFDSYSEVSPSGKGLHIIVKGVVPSGKNNRTYKVEVYSSGRFFTMTGNVYRDKPIAERQGLLTQLWEQLGGKEKQNENTHISQDLRFDDEQIIEQCRNAITGPEFSRLFAGEFGPGTPGYETRRDKTQSAADLALANFIAYQTKNHDQFRRIFWASALGKRSKAHTENYMRRLVEKAYDQTVSLVNFDGFKEALQSKLQEQRPSEIINETMHKIKASVAQSVEPTAHNSCDLGSNPSTSTILPPGLIGEIAQYIYHSSARPVWEIALAGAIGLMAGICGKAYNANHSGLNLFVLVVADTGVGKEAPATAIGILMNEVNKQSICANEFIGPSEFASGQALLKELKDPKRQSFVSILGEFGFRLKSMCDPRANAAETKLLGTLLDMFAKSGGRAVLGANVYSDKDKSTEAIDAPSMSLLADTTPGTFYNILNEEMIDMGLLPRFLIMEYKGKRAYLNENMIRQPSTELIGKLVSLTASVKSFIHSKKTIDAQVTADAYSLLKRFDVYSTDIMNDSTKGFVKHLWNRAHLKIQRLATLVAIGINPHNPLVDESCVNWAAQLITKDIEQLCSKFDGGEIGKDHGEPKQLKEVLKVVLQHIKDWDAAKKYGTSEKLHQAGIIPYTYISRRLIDTASFRKDLRGPTEALKRTIQLLIDRGSIIEINKEQLKQFSTTQRCFVVSDPNLFEGLL